MQSWYTVTEPDELGAALSASTWRIKHAALFRWNSSPRDLPLK
jgi:hypothetical protein